MRALVLLVAVALASGARAADRLPGSRPPATLHGEDDGEPTDDLDAPEEEVPDEDEDLRAVPPLGAGEERDRALDEPVKPVPPPALRTGPAEPTQPVQPLAPE